MTEEVMAIITGVGIGMRDCNRPVLWFETNSGNKGASLQVFDWEKAKEIIRDYWVKDAHDLNGKPCWVEIDGAFMKYTKPCKIK